MSTTWNCEKVSEFTCSRCSYHKSDESGFYISGVLLRFKLCGSCYRRLYPTHKEEKVKCPYCKSEEEREGPKAGHPGFYAILAEMAALHEKKASDYGLGKDVLANCRGSEEFGIPAWVGVVMRMNDKMTRLKSFAQKGVLANESAEDSLLDMACYSLIALILMREGKK